jgi:hypothetical protein
MKKTIAYLAAGFFLATVLTACGATTKKMIATESESVRTDVFTEVAGTGTIPAGYADVIIRANIKTHLEGYYILESKDLHGKPGYPFLINIDGQAILWKVDGAKDIKPAFEKASGRSRDPEAGEGMKYMLEKKIRLAAGPHKVFFGLSEESYYVMKDITVEGGRLYVLAFEPRYGYVPKPHRSTFLKGINNYEVLFVEISDRVRRLDLFFSIARGAYEQDSQRVYSGFSL